MQGSGRRTCSGLPGAAVAGRDLGYFGVGEGLDAGGEAVGGERLAVELGIVIAEGGEGGEAGVLGGGVEILGGFDELIDDTNDSKCSFVGSYNRTILEECTYKTTNNTFSVCLIFSFEMKMFFYSVSHGEKMLDCLDIEIIRD